MTALLLVSVVLIFVMIRFYYAELDNQLFVERGSHLQEITEKVADIFDITIARAWDSVNTLEQFLFMEDTQLRTEDGLMQRLKDTSRFRTSEDNIFLLLDDDFRYYASDGGKGCWRELPLIIQTQELITTLPYQNSSLKSAVFDYYWSGMDAVMKNGKIISAALSDGREVQPDEKYQVTICGSDDDEEMYPNGEDTGVAVSEAYRKVMDGKTLTAPDKLCR